MNSLLYVGGISYQTTVAELAALFSNYGKVEATSILIDKLTGRTKGFGYVCMENPEEAIKELNSVNFSGRNLTVSLAKPMEPIDRHNENNDFTISKPKYSFIETININSDTGHLIDVPPIVQITTDLSTKYIEHFKLNPDEIYNLNSGEFEDLIAFMLRETGFEVEKTKQTHDGGKDLIAYKKGMIDFKIYVECKAYNQLSKIGVGIVRQFHSVVEKDKVNKGIIATTSFFSKDAQVLINHYKHLLDGKDGSEIKNWISLYKES